MTSLALAVPLTVVSVLGLLLNIYILFVVLVTKQVQTANNLLLLHLGAVDALLCLTFLVFSAPEMLEGWAWVAFAAPCNLHGFLFTLLHPVALWTICGLNCDRYYAITSPLHYGSVVNPKKVVIGLCVTWLVSLVLCIPPLFLVAPYRFDPGLGGCAPDFGQKESSIWYSLTYTTFTLFLPAVLILGSNLRVLTIARYHRHRIASAIFEVTISAQVTITHQRNPFFVPTGNLFRGRSAASTVLQLIGSFLLLYFPYYGVILWESSSSVLFAEWNASSNRFHPFMVTLASTLLNCSPPVNGLLYGVRSKVLRKSFQNYWRKKMSKSEMNQEIQARTPSTCGSRRPSLTAVLSGRPPSSHLQRRCSEASLEHRATASGTSSAALSSTGPDVESAKPSGSFRDAPAALGCELFGKPFASRSGRVGRGPFLRRIFGFARAEAVSAPRGTSPRILVTREDGDRSPPTPARLELAGRSYSSSSSTTTTATAAAALADKRRRKRLRYRDEDEASRSADSRNKRICSRSSSSDEDNTGRIYLSFEGSSSEQDVLGGEAIRRGHLPSGSMPNSSWPVRRKNGLPGLVHAKSAANIGGGGGGGTAEFQL